MLNFHLLADFRLKTLTWQTQVPCGDLLKRIFFLQYSRFFFCFMFTVGAFIYRFSTNNVKNPLFIWVIFCVNKSIKSHMLWEEKKPSGHITVSVILGSFKQNFFNRNSTYHHTYIFLRKFRTIYMDLTSILRFMASKFWLSYKMY